MKSLVRTSAVLLPLAVALVFGEAALARSPSPTPTSTPTVGITPSPTWTPWPTATPTLPPAQLARFTGKVWLPPVNNRVVTAKIGDTVCASTCPGPHCLQFPIDPAPAVIPYELDVVPQEVKPGCGYYGATVTFFVGDKQVSQTAVWYAGSLQEVNLSSGLPAVYFEGQVKLFRPDWMPQRGTTSQ